MRPCVPSLGLLAAVCTLSLAPPALAAPDEYRSHQWGLDAVSAPVAWTQSDGDGVVVAVIDSGVQVDHPDLAANIWTNPDEVAGNGVDDDQNGIVDDVHGANTLDNSGDVRDDHDHGTLVAGVIAARAGNGIGGAGVAPKAQIMPVKVCDLERECPTDAQVAGIRYAVSEGARIINVSMATPFVSQELRDAIAVAEGAGATVVAAAGNNDRDLDATPEFPAALPDAAILSVTGMTENGRLYGNFGSDSVDLAAPGQGIISTAPGSTYERTGGSSVAAPFVAGSLALLAAARPELTQADLRAALLETADPLAKVGAGSLDVGAAMRKLVPGTGDEPVAHTAIETGVRAAATPRRARLRLRSPQRVRSNRSVMLRWKLSGDAKVSAWIVRVDGRERSLCAAKRGIQTKLRSPGSHRWTVVGYDREGHAVARASRSVRVLG